MLFPYLHFSLFLLSLSLDMRWPLAVQACTSLQLSNTACSFCGLWVLSDWTNLGSITNLWTNYCGPTDGICSFSRPASHDYPWKWMWAWSEPINATQLTQTESSGGIIPLRETRLSFLKEKNGHWADKTVNVHYLHHRTSKDTSLQSICPLLYWLEPLCLLLGLWMHWASSLTQFSWLALHRATSCLLNKKLFASMPPNSYSAVPSLLSILVVILFMFQGPAQLSTSLLPSPNTLHCSRLCFLIDLLE